MNIAFFDIDQTIIPDTTSERLFVFYLAKKGKISLKKLFKMNNWFLKYFLTDFYKAVLQNKYYLFNEELRNVNKIAEQCFNDEIKSMISPQAIDKIAEHKENGEIVILLSGTLEILAKYVKEYVGADDVIATKLEIADSKITGKVFGLHPYHNNKVDLMKQYLNNHNLKPEKIYCYANSKKDIPFLEQADFAYAVNSDNKLCKYAKQKNWPVISWTM